MEKNFRGQMLENQQEKVEFIEYKFNENEMLISVKINK